MKVGTVTLSASENCTASTNSCDEPDAAADPDEPASPQDEPPEQRIGRCRVELNLLTFDTDPPLSGYIEHYLSEAAKLACLDSTLLTVAAVDDARMLHLQRQYKGEQQTTDVLTFDLREPEQQTLVADIVICVDEAIRQARVRGHEARQEALLYALHGLMHLLGFDDRERADALAMHRREDQLLTAIGVGPVYSREEKAL